jgi:hypothetical protein
VLVAASRGGASKAGKVKVRDELSTLFMIMMCEREREIKLLRGISSRPHYVEDAVAGRVMMDLLEYKREDE